MVIIVIIIISAKHLSGQIVNFYYRTNIIEIKKSKQCLLKPQTASTAVHYSIGVCI